MKDFTPEQARNWVDQELAKITTAAKAASRIKAEKQMLFILKTMTDVDLPNSEWAHQELLNRLLTHNA